VFHPHPASLREADLPTGAEADSANSKDLLILLKQFGGIVDGQTIQRKME